MRSKVNLTGTMGRFAHQTYAGHDDVSSETNFAREKHARHAAATELALEGIRATERRLQAFAKVWSGMVSSREKVGRRLSYTAIRRNPQPALAA